MELCNACGLCCNGAIFADVQLRPGDNKAQLESLGLQMKSKAAVSARVKFLQPCPAHDGCKCQIYLSRPQYCRQFECALLKNALAGRIKQSSALRLIGIARNKLADINRLLAELGDRDETLPHRVRFKRLNLRMNKVGGNPAKAASFSELTLAVHELNLLLAQSFYPGSELKAGQ